MTLLQHDTAFAILPQIVPYFTNSITISIPSPLEKHSSHPKKHYPYSGRPNATDSLWFHNHWQQNCRGEKCKFGSSNLVWSPCQTLKTWSSPIWRQKNNVPASKVRKRWHSGASAVRLVNQSPCLMYFFKIWWLGWNLWPIAVSQDLFPWVAKVECL